VIAAVAGSALIDGETFTLNDGINTPITTFEFSTVALGGGDTNTRVPYLPGDTAAQVAANIATAIGSVGASLQIVATATGTAFVNLTHTLDTTFGNVNNNQALGNGVVVVGLSGGSGGDCGATVGCKTSADCAPTLTCNASHKCQ
jgi:hypothetical protein